MSKQFARNGCKYPQIKVDGLHFNLIVIISFQIQSDGAITPKNVSFSQYFWSSLYSTVHLESIQSP